MAAYIVRTPLRHGGDEPTPPAKTVELDQAEGDALVALGALEPAPDDATGASKPLARMNRAELTAAAEAAGVEITVGMTNKQVAAAIEAKAAAGAAG